jgi:hypothetical protein
MKYYSLMTNDSSRGKDIETETAIETEMEIEIIGEDLAVVHPNYGGREQASHLLNELSTAHKRES